MNPTLYAQQILFGQRGVLGPGPITGLVVEDYEAEVPLLDEPGVPAPYSAYSLRLLRAAYAGPCVRVRRLDTGAETDIGFDGNGVVDTAAIIAHVGAGNTGALTKWYDQSGNARDLGGPSPYEMHIYDGSAIYTDANGKPYLHEDTSHEGLFLSFSSVASPHTIMIVGQGNGTGYLFDATSSVARRAFFVSAGNFALYAGATLTGSAAADTSRHVFTGLFNGASSELWIDGSSVASGNAGAHNMAGIRVGSRYNGQAGSEGQRFQEVIIWNTDLGADRPTLEANANAYWNVY